MVAINQVLEAGDADQTLQALQNEHLDLSDVFPLNKHYYQEGLLKLKQEKAEVRVCVCVHTFCMGGGNWV